MTKESFCSSAIKQFIKVKYDYILYLFDIEAAVASKLCHLKNTRTCYNVMKKLITKKYWKGWVYYKLMNKTVHPLTSPCGCASSDVLSTPVKTLRKTPPSSSKDIFLCHTTQNYTFLSLNSLVTTNKQSLTISRVFLTEYQYHKFQ